MQRSLNHEYLSEWLVIVISQDDPSVLLHKSEVKPRMSVNNKDFIQNAPIARI